MRQIHNLKNKSKISQKGFMAVEILVSCSIIVMSVLAITSVIQKSLFVSQRILHNNQAIFLIEEGADTVKMFRDFSWTNIANLLNDTSYFLSWNPNNPIFTLPGNGFWEFTTSSNTIDIFTRTITFKNVYRNNDSHDIVYFGQGNPLDVDMDGFNNEVDNCPSVYNVNWQSGIGLMQYDDDGDGLGNLCDPDIDKDDILNEIDEDIDGDDLGNGDEDACPYYFVKDDTDLDGIHDPCDSDADGDSNPDFVYSGGAPGDSYLDTGTRYVTVRVSWHEGTETINKELSFFIADIF